MQEQLFTVTLSSRVWHEHYERLGECVARAEGGFINQVRRNKVTTTLELNQMSLNVLLNDLADWADPSYWWGYDDRPWTPYARALANVRKQLAKAGA